MKHYKIKDIPQHTEQVLDNTTCDMCGGIIKPTQSFQVNEIEIKRRTGFSCPDGGSGEELDIDICGECFDNVILPFLKTKIQNVRIVDWDW